MPTLDRMWTAIILVSLAKEIGKQNKNISIQLHEGDNKYSLVNTIIDEHDIIHIARTEDKGVIALDNIDRAIREIDDAVIVPYDLDEDGNLIYFIHQLQENEANWEVS